MTKPDYAHIVFILDRSGSMASAKMDAIGGFNQFVEDNRKVSGECTITLVQFDHDYEVVQRWLPIDEVPLLNEHVYVPRGTTALLDAVGRAIRETGETLASKPEHERPSKVLVAILTDGHENASVEYTREQVAQMIAEQERNYQWAFVYVAAGIDAWSAAQGIGIHQANYAGGQDVTVGKAMRGLSEAAVSYRTGTASGDGLLHNT